MIPGAHPILSCADAQKLEKDLFGGDEGREWLAMSRAGRTLGTAVLDDARESGGVPDDARILVLCGKGHNGGDALIALHTILDARKRANALIVVVPGFSGLRPLTRRALENLWRAHRLRVEFVAVSGAANSDVTRRVSSGTDGEEMFDLCVDGLFGMQFRPPLAAPAEQLIALVNAHPHIRLRVAVDLPSGVADASDARPFRADFTYATGVAKAPLFTDTNRAAVGRVRYLDLEFFAACDSERRSRGNEAGTGARVPSSSLLTSAATGGSFVFTDHVLDPLRAPRPANADKRTFGHLFVVSGSRTMPGAVLMAVESALLSGVGLVTAFVPEALAPAFAARLPEAMWVPMPETLDGGLALEGRGSVVARAARCTGLLVGPGLGRDRESVALIAELLRAIDVPAVLDGDALQSEIVSAHYSGSTPARVLTPHAGEYERIAAGEPLPVAAARLGATIVLKGAPTRICGSAVLQPVLARDTEPGLKHRATVEPVYFSPFGGPVFSRGGSGDVLAGLIAGQLAQGMDPLEAAARGVVWHGLAADRLARANGQTSARVTELIPHLAAVLQEGSMSDCRGGACAGPCDLRLSDGSRDAAGDAPTGGMQS